MVFFFSMDVFMSSKSLLFIEIPRYRSLKYHQGQNLKEKLPLPLWGKAKTFLTLPWSSTDTMLTRPLSWQEAGNLKPFLHLKLIWIYHFEFQLMVYCLITRRWKLGNLAILEGRLQLIKLLSWISNKLWNVVLKSFLKIKVQKTMNIWKVSLRISCHKGWGLTWEPVIFVVDPKIYEPYKML